jgi:hypothetical protein
MANVFRPSDFPSDNSGAFDAASGTKSSKFIIKSEFRGNESTSSEYEKKYNQAKNKKSYHGIEFRSDREIKDRFGSDAKGGYGFESKAPIYYRDAKGNYHMLPPGGYRVYADGTIKRMTGPDAPWGKLNT